MKQGVLLLSFSLCACSVETEPERVIRQEARVNRIIPSGDYTPYSELDLSQVPVWPDAVINEQFIAMRDRFATWDAQGLPRRLSWLFPDAGCEVRAEKMVRWAEEAGLVIPYKIFVYNNAGMQTQHHPDRKVTFSFHVAPIVKAASTGVAYVLDPSIDHYQPLSVNEWTLRASPKRHLSKYLALDAAVYLPTGPVSPIGDEELEASLQELLDREWQRHLDLGRNPASSIVFSPPWFDEEYTTVGDITLPACEGYSFGCP